MIPATPPLLAHLDLVRRGAALLHRLGASRVILFGSLAKGRTPDFHSDVDLAVEGLPSDRFLAALGRLNTLGPCGVDLVELETAPPTLRVEIEQHGVELPTGWFPADTTGGNAPPEPAGQARSAMKISPPLADSLRAIIASDVGAARGLDASLHVLRARQEQGEELSEAERIAAAYYLHNIYNALENCFDQISRSFENHVVNTGQWHRELLGKMFLDLSPRRPAVLPGETRGLVTDLCAFRHFFRHSYGLTLDVEKLDGLRRRWERGGAAVLEGLERFANQLPTDD